MDNEDFFPKKTFPFSWDVSYIDSLNTDKTFIFFSLLLAMHPKGKKNPKYGKALCTEMSLHCFLEQLKIRKKMECPQKGNGKTNYGIPT